MINCDESENDFEIVSDYRPSIKPAKIVELELNDSSKDFNEDDTEEITSFHYEATEQHSITPLLPVAQYKEAQMEIN